MGLFATSLRLWMLHLNGGFHSAIEYDDGVHYGSALLLLHGQVPYRDFVFLQPPGITLTMTPFALLGILSGSSSLGFVFARIATACVAGLTAVLLGRFVTRESSYPRGLAAALLYATATSSLIAGSTIMIEPWLSLTIVAGLTFLRRDTAAALVAAGAFAGLGGTLKVWGYVFAGLTVLWLVSQRRGRELSRYLFGILAVSLLVYAPFLLLAPGALIDDVLRTQADRPPAGIQGIVNRWRDFLGFTHHDLAVTTLVARIALALLVFCCWRACRTTRLGSLVTLQILGAAALFFLAAPYYTHYGEYAVPFAAIVIALALPASRRSLIAMSAIALVGLCGFQVTRASMRTNPSSIDAGRLRALTRHASCVVSDQMTLQVLADASLKCAWLDPRGAALTTPNLASTARFYPYGFRRISSWELAWRDKLRAAQVLILTGSPCSHQEWDQLVCTYVEQHFRYVARVGSAGPKGTPVQVWANAPRRAARPVPLRFAAGSPPHAASRAG